MTSSACEENASCGSWGDIPWAISWVRSSFVRLRPVFEETIEEIGPLWKGSEGRNLRMIDQKEGQQ